MARNIAVRKQKAGSRNLLASKHGGKQYSIQKTLKIGFGNVFIRWKYFHHVCHGYTNVNINRRCLLLVSWHLLN